MLDTYRFKVDFSKVRSYADIHRILDESLDFAEFYYENLDSLYDCLTDMLCDISIIEIHGIEKLKKYDGYDKKVLEVFSETKHAWGEEYSDRFLVTVVHEDGTREELK